jgi:hypothetical protein
MANSLWPPLSATAPQDMAEMLYDLAKDISVITSGRLDFHIDAVGIGAIGAVTHIRYNCYLRVIKKAYLHLLFRVTTEVGSPFPAEFATPEGDSIQKATNQTELEQRVREILQRQRTKDVVDYLLKIAPL